jgi:hypothetical protein
LAYAKFGKKRIALTLNAALFIPVSLAVANEMELHSVVLLAAA